MSAYDGRVVATHCDVSKLGFTFVVGEPQQLGRPMSSKEMEYLESQHVVPCDESVVAEPAAVAPPAPAPPAAAAVAEVEEVGGQTDEQLSIRDQAKAAGITGWWNKSIARLEEELTSGD